MKVIADRYSKLTLAVSTSETSERHIATILYDRWIVPYEVPAYLLTESGTQFVRRFILNYMQLPWIEASLTHCIPPLDDWAGRTIK